MLRGWCSWWVLPGLGNLLNPICSGYMTSTCWNFFYDFSQQDSSFVRSTVVCSATFRQDQLLHLLNPYHTISVVTALQADALLEVACPVFCVLRDEHLSIDRPVCPFFAWPASSSCCWLGLLYRCYTSRRHIIT